MVVLVSTTFAKDLRGSNFEELNLPNKELADTLIHGKDLQNDILGFADKNELQRRELTTFGDRAIDYRANTGGGTFKFFAVSLSLVTIFWFGLFSFDGYFAFWITCSLTFTDRLSLSFSMPYHTDLH